MSDQPTSRPSLIRQQPQPDSLHLAAKQNPKIRRIRAQIGFSLPDVFDAEQVQAVIRTAGERLSARYGGCTIFLATGFWAANGHEFQAQYTDIANHRCLWISVSVVEGFRTTFRRALALDLAFIRDKHQIPDMKRVHVEWDEVVADHLNLGEPGIMVPRPNA